MSKKNKSLASLIKKANSKAQKALNDIKKTASSVSDKTKNTVASVVSVALLMSSILYLNLKSPEIHNAYLRYKVGSKVYMIKGKLNGGGGTGFSIKAPSGQTYIVTNSHVCEGALSQSEDKTSLIVEGEDVLMRRRVIENSDFTDLCLLEGIPGVEGLTLGSAPTLGETEWIVGHPLLRPLSVSKGDIVGATDVPIFTGFVTSPEDAERCNKRKNVIADVDVGFMMAKVCLNVTRNAYMSTITIYPGNSGSPVVSASGAVVGVAFASDMTHWAYIVSLDDLNRFLRSY